MKVHYLSIILICVAAFCLIEMPGAAACDKDKDPEDSSLLPGFVSKNESKLLVADQLEIEIGSDEEPYVDDIPFDTSEIVKSIKANEKNEKAEKPYSFFDFLIRWIALLINSL